MNNNRGFTLAEILAATFISMVMILAIGTAIESGLKSSGGIEQKVPAQQDVRSALEIMAMEIRMVSYNPTFNHNMWVGNAVAGGGISSCVNPSANMLYHGLQEATANSITVEMDISDGMNGDGQGALTEPNEIISYNYVANGTYASGNRYITRTASSGQGNCGIPQAFLGDRVASGNPLTVRVINADMNPQIPVFRYFDGQGNLLPPDGSPGGLPAQIPNVRMIEITLAVETAEINPDTGQKRTMIYTTREILRNHNYVVY
ncbi:MAG TPA: prepilin-type N-terminal cleavage/methylation domain-containing protein [Syntrophales bacterium]|nr:prepilin-type N-terminal cleavage/methylation domain-containing protein [Syntrophales bacterium]